MSADTIGFIKQHCGLYPLLTPLQEIELARQVQEGVALREWIVEKKATRAQERVLRRAAKAHDKMVCCNMRLSLHVATRYQRAKKLASLELSDLFQLGCLGLHRAVESFDPSRGYKFSTYAYWWIRQALQRHGGDIDHLIRLPADKRDVLAAVAKARQALGPGATLDDTLKQANCSPQAWDQIAMARMAPVSLDAPAGYDDGTGAKLIHEAIADPASLEDPLRLSNEARLRAVHEAIERIPHRTAQFVLKAHYGLCGEPRDMQSIGKELGLSRERVRQLKEKGLNQLRLQVHRYDTELRYEVA